MMKQLKYWLAKRMVSRSKSEPKLSLEELETKHKNPDEPLFNDSSYFNGLGKDGSYFVVRQSFRTTRGNEYWLRFFLPSIGELDLKHFEGEEGKGFQQGYLRFVPLELGKRWNIVFLGHVWQGETKHQIKIDLIFDAVQPLVDFSTLTQADRTAKALASASWSRSFFQKLREMKKIHTEQGGKINGAIYLDGQRIAVEDWHSVRDHSWGIRDWSYWKRHVWFSGVLENGEAFNVSFIAYSFLSGLSAGYLTSDGKVYPLLECPDMESFTQHPPTPKQGKIQLTFTEGKQVELEWKIYGNFDFIMDDTYAIYEGMAEYHINGVKGRGVAEFGAII